MSIAEYKNLDDDDPEDRQTYWANRIKGHLQKSVEEIIQAGLDLIEAKDELGHGKFTAMVEQQLQIKLRSAEILIRIAKNPELANPKHVSLLPPHWGTLAALDRLPRDVLKAKIIDGTVNPKMERRDVAKLKPGGGVVQHKAKMAPIQRLKDEKEELVRHAADLEERLNSTQQFLDCAMVAGSNDTAEGMADQIIAHAGEVKAKEIANAILQRFKRRPGRPAKAKQQAAIVNILPEPMSKQRYSIWGREYGSDHDVELAQVNSNPQPVLDGLAMKMLSVNHSAVPGGKKTKIRKYSLLRIVENELTRTEGSA